MASNASRSLVLSCLVRSDPPVGAVLEGRFRLDAVLARGGMGIIYVASDLRREIPVVVKVLAEDVADVPSIRARAEREGAILSRLSHPNIVELHHRGWTEHGVPFIVLEYLEGHALHEVIARESPLPQTRVLDVLRQVARALRAAHRADVIHRDVKPQNVMLTPDLRRPGSDLVKLVDFGVAAIGTRATFPALHPSRTLTEPGMLLGSPRYMAPEQLFGEEIDARADLYSVGAIAFEMLTGVVPLDGDSISAIVRRKAAEHVPPVSTVGWGRDASPELEALVMVCLEREPSRRFASADELLVALEDIEDEDDLEFLPPPRSPEWTEDTLDLPRPRHAHLAERARESFRAQARL